MLIRMSAMVELSLSGALNTVFLFGKKPQKLLIEVNKFFKKL